MIKRHPGGKNLKSIPIKMNNNRRGKEMLTIPQSSDPPAAAPKGLQTLLLLIRGLESGQRRRRNSPLPRSFPDFSRDGETCVGRGQLLITNRRGAAAVGRLGRPWPCIYIVPSASGSRGRRRNLAYRTCR
jgi:hypothetical protein